MGGTCGVSGCASDAEWIRVSQYGDGAALYICDQHWNLVRLRNDEDAECYTGLPHRGRMSLEMTRPERIAASSRGPG